MNSYWNVSAYSYPHRSIFINNTFVDNKAESSSNTGHGYGGAFYYSGNQSTVLINNNFWGNREVNGTDTTRWEIRELRNSSSNVIVAAHNNFQYAAASANSYGDNNMSRDPQFVLGSGADKYLSLIHI